MRTFILTVLSILFIAGNSFAITGLGFGVRGGLVAGLDTGGIEEIVRESNPDATVDDNMTMIGGHVKIGTLPVLDFEVAAEYAWKKMDLYEGYKLKISDFSITATAIYNVKLVPAPMVTPYVGAGLGTHKLVYSIDKEEGFQDDIPLDEDATKMGYHGLLGVKIHPPMFPLEFFAQYRYTYISTDEEATKYSTILAGATFNLP